MYQYPKNDSPECCTKTKKFPTDISKWRGKDTFLHTCDNMEILSLGKLF